MKVEADEHGGGKRAESSVIIDSNILEIICFPVQFSILNNLISFNNSKS